MNCALKGMTLCPQCLVRAERDGLEVHCSDCLIGNDGRPLDPSITDAMSLCSLVSNMGLFPEGGGLFDQDPVFIKVYQIYLDEVNKYSKAQGS